MQHFEDQDFNKAVSVIALERLFPITLMGLLAVVGSDMFTFPNKPYFKKLMLAPFGSAPSK